MHITHHFTPGLRFDTLWEYQTSKPSGGTRWAPLPMSLGKRDGVDAQGAWWCCRRCAAVLLRRPWRAMGMPSGLPMQPGADEVAQVLGQLLPGWQVARPAHATQAPVLPCARALDQGGSALLLLQSGAAEGRAQHLCWAWVVGVEWQARRGPAVGGTDCGAACRPASGAPAEAGLRMHPQALLTVPFGWPMPGSIGYAARVRMQGPGQCQVDGIHGQRSESRCLAAITLAPPGDSGRDRPHASGPFEARPGHAPG